jgi:lysyl-tRNA synthetase class 2
LIKLQAYFAGMLNYSPFLFKNMAELQQDEQDQIKQRRSKLTELRMNGIAFPTDFRRDVIAGELLAEYGEKSKEELEAQPRRVKVAGRMMTRRVMGKASFCHIQDMSGKIQLYVTRDTLPEGFYNEQFKKWDIGDIIGAEGVLFKTQTDELSVKVDAIRLLTKALRPLPEKFHGLADQEARYRQRYLDLIMSDQSRQTFRLRSKIVAFIRQFLTERQFLEVETPMMQTIPGGATARPFKTHHNALDMGLYLRIAPELYLKRLVVGGFERVFEINRNFRNEGLSTRHNPEFTMLEFYQAYAEYGDLMDLTEEMVRGIAQSIVGQPVIDYQGERYDFSQPFVRMTVAESILHFNPELSAADLTSRDALVNAAKKLHLPIKDSYGIGKLQIEIFEKTVESRLMQPTFITAYPVEVSPLARRNDHDPEVTDRFEFFVGGREIANGFTELNDAEDQAERFRKQVEDKEAGDEEAMHYDADYITALEHGMPPTAGEGIGIDRLVMLFADASSIRDVLLFPHMRPKN